MGIARKATYRTELLLRCSRVRELLRHGGEKRPEWRTNQTYQPLAA